MNDSRFMRFMGGKNIVFGLIVFILLGILIFILDRVSFIFDPFLTIFKTIIGPIIVAFILYYLLNPIVNFMERYRIKRLWGIIIILAVIILLISLLLTILIPLIEKQIISLSSNFPDYMNDILKKFNDFSSHSFLAPYMTDIQDWVNKNLSDFPKKVSDYLGNISGKIRSIIDTVMNVAIVIMTFPFVLFFLLKDGAQYKQYLLRLTPPKWRWDVHTVLTKMNIQVGSYIQGQLIVSICIGILLFFGYEIIGLDYALVLASIAAVTSVVPYLGPMIAISPAVIISLVDSPVMLLKLLVVWIAVQFLEGHFISPNIMGKTMQIHPLTIIFVLLCAGNLMGIIGVILGIPFYAILKVIGEQIFYRFQLRYNQYYGEQDGKYDVNVQKNDNF